MGTSILIGFVAVIALVLIVFGAGVGVVPLLLVVAAIPAIAALARRIQGSRRTRAFRAQSGLGDGTVHSTRDADEPIHGPTG